MKTLHTGGATGADTVFEDLALARGWKVRAYSFPRHRTDSRNRVILSDEELWEGLEQVKAAAKVLGRSIPLNNQYVLSLLCRNWHQVKNSEAVFAVANLDDKEKFVLGGTGWAVAMSILNKKPVYLYAQNLNKLLTYSAYKWIQVGFPGFPENYAGIGSRDLKPNGVKAINRFYELEDKKNANSTGRG